MARDSRTVRLSNTNPIKTAVTVVPRTTATGKAMILGPVSYTHLDVYKRQHITRITQKAPALTTATA